MISPPQMRIFRLTRLLLGLHGLALGGLAVAADKPESVTLQLKWHHQFQFAGYYAAQAKGFYTAEGLDVTLVPGTATRGPLDAVLAGRANYGISDSDIALARLKSQPVVACAAIFQHSPYVLLSRFDRGIRSPADLIGARVMMSDDQGAAQVRAMLLREGIDPGRVREIPHSWNLDDLIGGRTDAVSAYATVEPAQLEARGVKAAMLRSIDYGVDFYGDTIFTTEAEIKDRPRRTAAFVRASLQGWDYAMKHPAEIVDLILAMPGVHERGATREILLREARDMRPFILPDVVEIGHINPGRWRNIAESFIQAGMAPAGATLGDFVYQPNPAINPTYVKWAQRVAVLILVAAAASAFWNLQMRRQVRARTAALTREIDRRQEAETVLAIAGEMARFGGWSVEVGTGHVYFSDELCRIYDLAPGSAVSFEEGIGYHAPEHRDRIGKALTACAQTGVPFDEVSEIVTASGRRIWARGLARARRGPDGKITHVVGSFQDISDFQRQEERLRQTAAQLQELLQESPTLLFTLKRVDGRLVPAEVSGNVERLLGYTRTEALQPDWWRSHVHPEDRNEESVAGQALAVNDEFVHEYRMIRKDGTVIWIIDRLRVVRREAGQPVLVNGAWNDNTLRRQAESALRESEERLRLALRAAQQGLYDLNVQTGEAIVSPEYATMLGYDPKEFHETNSAWIERLHPEDREPVAQVYRDYVNGRRPEYRVEFRQRTRSGEWKWVLSLGRLVERTPEGAPLRMLGTHTDITGPKQAEEKILRLSRLYLALSKCNEAIVRCANEEDLLAAVCRHAVDFGGAKMAWIGLVDPATLEVRVAASHGEGTEYLNGLRICVAANDPTGRGPTGTAIRENQTIWCDDFANDPHTAPWRERGARFGWASSAALPLRREGAVIGAFTLYTGVHRVFDAETRALLEQMTTDLNFGLDNFAREAARRRSEAALRESLREKDALLKEVHHRVKNNLQVITSLLRLETGRNAEPATQTVLKEMQGRIRSMALLHETLYRSGNLAQVDLGVYLERVAGQTFRSMNELTGRLRLRLDLKACLVAIDQAIPCGLIVNELVSNSLKHGFPGGRTGEISLILRQADDAPQVRLHVTDTGVGLPADFAARRERSLGIQLVEDLVRQLHGNLASKPGPGAEFIVTFLIASRVSASPFPT